MFPTTLRMGIAAAKRNSAGKVVVVGSNLGAGKVFLPAKDYCLHHCCLRYIIVMREVPIMISTKHERFFL